MSFWGAEVTTRKEAAYVPPPDLARLHLSQVTLAQWAVEESPVPIRHLALVCKSADNPPLRLCVIQPHHRDTCNLDLVFDQYTEFSLTGLDSKYKELIAHSPFSVHLTGYYVPQDEEPAEEEEEERELTPKEMDFLTAQLATQHGMDQDSEEDEDYDSDEFSSESEDYDSHASDSDSGEGQAYGASSVIIEDVTYLPEPQPSRPAIELPAAVGAEQNSPATTSSKPEGRAAKRKAKAAIKAELAAASGAPATPNSVGNAPPGATKSTPAGAPSARKRQSDAGSTPGPKKRLATGEQSKATTSTGSGKAGAASGEETPVAKKKVRRYENGFQIEDLAMGQPDGAAALPGKRVTVQYVGSLQKTGKVFDQSKGKGFTFRLGVGEVIKGWDLGVVGMRLGDRRKLTIPPQLAYGSDGVRGTIPPNSFLEFDVKLAKVQ